MGLMNEYLSSDNRVKLCRYKKLNFVVIKNVTISFTTSYGAKSILLLYKEEEKKTKVFEKKRTFTIQLHEKNEEHSGNCNAENYLSRTAKHCKVR